MLPFVSICIKDIGEMIHFHIKYTGVQGLVSVEITSGKCTINFSYENGEVGIKTSIVNLLPLLAANVSAR